MPHNSGQPIPTMGELAMEAAANAAYGPDAVPRPMGVEHWRDLGIETTRMIHGHASFPHPAGCHECRMSRRCWHCGEHIEWGGRRQHPANCTPRSAQ